MAGWAVCGVVGLLLRDPSLQPRLGELLVPMIEALDERGPDSSGIAVYADRPTTESAPTLRLSLGADETVDWLALGCSLLEVVASGSDMHRFGAGLVLDLPEASLAAVQERLAEEW